MPIQQLTIRSCFPLLALVALLTGLLLSFTPLAARCQQPVLQGRLTNPKGEPVSGATVTALQAKRSTLSAGDGIFRLPGVKAGDSLRISHISFAPAGFFISDPAAFLTIQLAPAANTLGEVEVLSSGYQDIPRERSTGSFVRIDKAALNLQAGTNILNRLDGITSGLLFDVGKSNGNQGKLGISIRGLSTINGPIDPLVVVDGYIYEGDINNINPNDVEQVTVMKDAAAASIWGARAGNGVILITTRKGRYAQPLQVSVNASLIIAEKPDLYYLPQLGAAEYIGVEQFLFGRGYFNNRINTGYQALTPAVEVFLARRRGLISAADSADRINALKAIDTRDQFLRHMYREALTQQYALNLRGGSANHAYTFSLAYDRSSNELDALTRKLNIQLGNSFRILKNLELDLSLYFTNAHGQSGRPGINQVAVAGRSIPYLQLAGEDGSPLPVARDYRSAYTDTLAGGRLLDWKYYPLEDYRHNRSTDNRQELFANIGLRYRFSKWLNAEIKYQYQDQQSGSERLAALESYEARDMVNRFTQVDRSNGNLTRIVPLGGIRNYSLAAVRSQTLRGQLNLMKQWQDHELAAVAGIEGREARGTGEGSIRYGYNSDPLTTTLVDPVNPYPTILTGRFERIPGMAANSHTLNRFVSVYANAAYTFRNRYSLSASARRDGANVFGANTNDRWKPLWSVGAAWNISREDFYQLRALPSLKLRMSYGFSGNVDLSRSAVAIGRYYAASSVNLPFARINVINNPDLRWEKIGMFNIGLDFQSANNRLSGTLEFYNKRGIDLYGTEPYDYTTWGLGSELRRNVANMEGKGIDLTLNARLVDRKVKWNSNLIFSYVTNETTRYNSASAANIASIIGNGNTITPYVGKPLYAIAAYRWGGLDGNGHPQGYLDGKLSTDYAAIFQEANQKGPEGNVVYIGPASPPVFGSWINTLSWKQLSLTLSLAYRFGYYFRRPFFTSGSLVNGSGHPDFNRRWQQPGDEAFTQVPAFVYPVNGNRDAFYGFSEVNVLKGDHIRLQFLNLAYTLGGPKACARWLKDAQLYCIAANLGILWRANSEGLDPDYPRSLPPARNLSIGLRMNL
ncbi:SusC/RagA family TonB-linked outer membrane protein [Flavihumibacter rivuli]|uniref:SusC/RagA family TonB-linked outer membrane protein n=1 Tax=Flavihumibacter rivuli TaxID=2838156 RepID=UPI001BDE7D99|nr:SusC/RagA family TonB-linked outer membrane protein [Flavihumibacter rivuli]ULQ55860.1 SusC/RagA family TonB-linked outer membrane protein [Flavihumibacter rivuli]